MLLTHLANHAMPLLTTHLLAAAPAGEAGDGVPVSHIDLETLFSLGFVVIMVGIFGVVSAMNTAARERTRREIAAYIAEGTMTTEQGERLIKAKFKGNC